MLVALVLAATVGLVPTSAPAVQYPQDLVVSADPIDYTPHVLDGTVFAIAVVGDTVVVGGSFTQVRQWHRTDVLDRSNLFAYDKNTGAILPDFAPDVNGEVLTLAADPSSNSVFVGGKFTTVDGQKARKLTKLDATTGQVDPTFVASVNGWVNDVKVSNGEVFVGGRFGRIKGQAREALAAVDPVTGKVDPDLAVTMTDTGAHPVVLKVDVTPDGSKLVAIGHFKQVDGLDRPRVVVIDRTSSPDRVSGWAAPVLAPQCRAFSDRWVRDMDISPDGTWFALATTGAWGGGTSPVNRLCDSVSRWDLTNEDGNQTPVWVNETGGDTILAVAVTNAAVYAGGHQRWQNDEATTKGDSRGTHALDRSGIAALDVGTGRALTWNPGRARGLGVRDLVATDDSLYVGDDTWQLGGEYHLRFGAFPLEGGAPPEVDHSADPPGSLTAATLVEADRGRCLDVGTAAAGTAAVAGDCTGATGQRFTLNGAWQVRDDASGLCLDAGDGDRSTVTTQPCNGSMAQYWVRNQDTIVNVVDLQCLDATGHNSGDAVEVRQCDGSSGQSWAPTP